MNSATKRTFKAPPLVSTAMLPEDVYSLAEMSTLKDWLSATLGARGNDDFEKASKPFSKDRRASIAKMLSDIRAQGYFPDRIDENGGIVWGFATKGPVQVDNERNCDFYERRGKQIIADGGFLLGVMVKPGFLALDESSGKRGLV